MDFGSDLPLNIASNLPRARQPHRPIWSKQKLIHERALALGEAIDMSMSKSYGSALNSYLSFVHSHNIPVEPTADTLSLYATYMSHFINPRSVNCYLSGICQQLEPHFPNIRDARSATVVKRTLIGCKRLRGSATKRKLPLTLVDLQRVIDTLDSSFLHNDKLFLAMLLTGFFGLLRLGELALPDDESIRDWRKVAKRGSVSLTMEHYEFLLPAHKADRFFEGNKVVIQARQYQHNPLIHFKSYILSRDHLHGDAPPLWLRENGLIPTRSFFINRLRRFFGRSIAGQSMRAGGATSLAEHGVPPSWIQAMGRWSSDAFHIYIRKNPAIIQGLLYGRSANSTMS